MMAPAKRWYVIQKIGTQTYTHTHEKKKEWHNSNCFYILTNAKATEIAVADPNRR
jgi:hypothetical protein